MPTLIYAWDSLREGVCILMDNNKVIEWGRNEDCDKIIRRLEEEYGRPRVIGGIITSGVSIEAYEYAPGNALGLVLNPITG